MRPREVVKSLYRGATKVLDQRTSLHRLFVTLAVIGIALIAKTADAQIYLNAQLPWHPAVLDEQRLVLAWYHPEKHLGYDQFLRLDWNFLEHKVPIDSVTHVKVYLTAPIFVATTFQGTSWQHNPASFYAHLMDLLRGWYPYSGDTEAIGVMREMLDYQLAHGTTPKDWDWAGVPFATACTHDKDYGHCFEDVPREFFGGIESDKIGELGFAYVLFYEMVGDRKYLDAGLQCANQLEKHIRPGDAAHTPWPFRIDARTGGVIAGEEYGGMVVASVRLFDELIRLGEPRAPAYKKARDLAWKWILENPMNKDSVAWDRWTGYYEDVQKEPLDENDMSSIMTAQYILSQDDPANVDQNWKDDVGHLLDRSRGLLGRGPYFGAWAIDEQMRPDGGQLNSSTSTETAVPAGRALPFTNGRGCCSRAGLVCRTSQWGAVNAMYFEKTHDGQALENAFRSLNYATYFEDSEGKIAAAGDDYHHPYWFEDGYADAGRSFMWAMGAVPDFAPIGENHLLHSTSVVQKVTYGSTGVDYQTFDSVATEVLRLTFKPASVIAGGAHLAVQDDLKDDAYTVRNLPGGDYEVRVRHVRSNKIRIEKS
jgi:hypothetical protein